MKLTHASVFSGIGGPEIAATMLGWDNVFHCEINPFGRAVLDYWFPKAKSYEDITKTDFSEWRGRVTVLTGGFPCQPFSYAGQRRGADDDRYLWPQMLRAIDECRPTWVVGENVAGIVSMVEQGEFSQMDNQANLFDESDQIHRYQYRQPFTIERVCKDLEDLGYTVQPIVIPACAVGAPHRRDRVFIIATNTESQQGERHEPQQPRPRRTAQGELGGGNSKDGCQRNVADTSDIGAGQREQAERQECGRPSLSEFGERYGASLSADGGVCGERWANFPSVSPVCGRNDGLSRNVVRYINDKVYDELKEYFRNEDLSRVWQVFQSPKVRQSLGRLYKIHETDLLLKVVFGAQTGRRPESDGDGLSARSDEVSERVLRKLRKQRASSCASQRLQYQEQLTGELGYALPALSFDLALAAKTIEEEVLRMMTYVRTESLKAYGNAIVPQVMYEIFRAIEIVEREKL